MKAFFARSYFCQNCNVAYNNVESHRCIMTCPCCYATPQCKQNKNGLKFCNDCYRYFRNEACFTNHKLIKKQNRTQRMSTTSGDTSPTSICDRIQCCKKCKKHVQRAHKKQHKCGYFDCKTCKIYVKQEGTLTFYFLNVFKCINLTK